ncbi:MAG TPA: sigma-70 family RNA polymerase sigma factor [bacterium]|nr:sigma-70 family RNA polymerase sigma factor [bacterium]
MIQAYLSELSKVRCLEPHQEAELWKRYKYGDDVEARAKIIESYQPLVYKIVSGTKAKSEVMLDLIQEGTVGLIEAVERFDPGKNIKFTTYAPFRIRGRIINYLEKNNTKNVTLDQGAQAMQEIMGMASMFADPTDTKKNVEKIAEDQMLLGVVLKSLSRLSDKERAVVTGIYIEDKKATDLAKELGISNSYLSRLQKKGIRRLRGMLSRLMKEMK